METAKLVLGASGSSMGKMALPLRFFTASGTWPSRSVMGGTKAFGPAAATALA